MSIMVSNQELSGAVVTGRAPQQKMDNPLAKLVRATLEAITGDSTINTEKGNTLYKLLLPLELMVAEKVLHCGLQRYEGNTKYPSFSYWKTVKRDVLRVEEMNAPKKAPPKIADEEQERVKQIARDTALRLITKSTGSETKNPLEKKLARYRKYIQDDLVRVEERGHALDQKWIPRKQAHSIGVEYHDPVEYMQARKEAIMK